MKSSHTIICCFIAICLQEAKITAFPQIFNEVYDFCKHSFDDRNMVVPNKIWTVNNPNKNFVIYFSLCPSPHGLESTCKSKTSCMITQNRIVDLGSSLKPVNDSLDLVLKSISGVQCPTSRSQNYSLTVNLQCTNSIKPGARLVSQDDCNFEVDMMSPDCVPKCTTLISNSYLLDMRQFPKNLEVRSDNYTFHLTPCGPLRVCGSPEISACQELVGKLIPLSRGDSQHISYDLNQNALSFRGRYKQGRVLREVIVLAKCNWATNLSNLTYKKPSVQGRKFKFEVESSFGCVKLPHSCTVMGLDGIKYNLTRLDKRQGWAVRNVTGNRRLVMNICGQLKQRSNNLCSVQQSQICETSGTKFVNKGSILGALQVLNDDIIKAVFTSGSVCEENSNSSYNTEINFECSRNEMGPVFQKEEDCTTFITWRTPEACPVEHYEGDNCRVSDLMNGRTLQSLWSSEDKVHPLSPGTNLTYNLCGPLHAPCNNFTNVSFCIRSSHGDFVLGWLSTRLISDNTNLKLALEGDLCPNTKVPAKILIDFVCSFENSSSPTMKFVVVQHNCEYKMTVFTSHACSGDDIVPDCKLKKGNVLYDLTPLTLKNKNYVINDDEGNRYSLNVCGPLITNPNMKCRGNTMVCVQDPKQENVKHQFVAIGGVSSPQWSNNALMIESTIGDYCRVGYGHYKTKIKFECSPNDNLPRLESKQNCVYNFIWPTKYACDTCVVSDSKTHALFDLNKIIKYQRLKISRDDNLKYDLDLCRNTYKECANDSSRCYEKPLSRQFVQDKNQIVLDLHTNCSGLNGYEFNRIVFHLECERISNNEHFIKRSVENCVLSIASKTQSVCSNETNTSVDHVSTKTIKSSTMSTIEETSNSPVIESKFLYNCLIIDQYTGYNFYLWNISSFHNSKNVINFDGKASNCNGIWCRGNEEILPFSQSCPNTIYHYTNSSMALQFSSETNCLNSEKYSLEIVLVCAPNPSKAKFIKDGTCNLIVHLASPEACRLFKKAVYSPLGAIIAGCSAGIALLLIASFALFCVLKRNRHPICLQRNYSSIESSNKMEVRVYCKNSTD